MVDDLDDEIFDDDEALENGKNLFYFFIFILWKKH